MTSTTTLRRRLARAAVGAVAISAVAGISATSASAGKGHTAASAMSCTLSATAVGAPLTLSGTGFAPNSSYPVQFVWPARAGSASTATWSDGSGNLSVSTYAYWAGSYTANVLGSHGRTLASCSTSVF